MTMMVLMIPLTATSMVISVIEQSYPFSAGGLMHGTFNWHFQSRLEAH